MKKTISLTLAALLIAAVCIGITACGDSSDGGSTADVSWVGTYTMTDELGNEWTLEITESEYQDEYPGELRFRIGDMFTDLATPVDNTLTSELLDSSGTATLVLQDDGSIVVTCDATDSMYAPPIGTYTK